SPNDRSLWIESPDQLFGYDRCGASRAVLDAKAECQLWAQKGDDRRNAPQQAMRRLRTLLPSLLDRKVRPQADPSAQGDPGQPLFNLIICRARLSPSPG